MKVILTILILVGSCFAQQQVSGQSEWTGNYQLLNAVSAPLAITTVTAPRGTVSTIYSFLIPVTGGFPAYTCTLTSGTLPSAVSVSSAPASQGCLISGTLGPASGGTYTGITVQVCDTHLSCVSNSPTYTIIVIFPQTLGPPSYLGALTTTAAINMTSPLPNPGTVNACPGNSLPCYPTGAGTVMTDTQFNPAVPVTTIRVTDANTECGTRNGFTQFASVGGSGDVNIFSASDDHIVINDQGNALLMLSFNPSTFAVGNMYASLYNCASGGRGSLTVPAGEFSYTNDNLYYGIQTAPSCQATTCPNQTSVSVIDVTSPTAPVFTNLFDFKNCLPTGSPTVSWVSQGGVDVADRYFGQDASLTGGGQNTGGDAMFFDRTTQICYLYDTIGNIDPARTALALAGAPATYTLTSQQVVITLANTFTSGQILYMVGITGTLNVLNGYAIKLTATSTSTITGTLTSKLGHADVTGTMAGASCSGTPTVQCANIGTIAPAFYKFTGPSWTMSMIGYVNSSIGSFTLHNDKIGKDGSFIVEDAENCLTVCATTLMVVYWQPETIPPTVTTFSNSGGHWSEGYRHWFNEGGVPSFSWLTFPIATPPITTPVRCLSALPTAGTATCLIFPNPPTTCSPSFTPTPCITNMDSHPNWNTNNPIFQATWGLAQDSTPISTSIYSGKWIYGTPTFGPWISEVDILDGCVMAAVLPTGCNVKGNAVLREGSTYNTAQNTHFDTEFQIGAGDPQGRFYIFSTDHGGQFGQQPGAGTTVNVTKLSISSLVGSFTYSGTTLTAGQQVALYGLQPIGTVDQLNGIYVTVSATGLSSTTFQGAFPSGTPNLSLTTITGTATVVTCTAGNYANCRGDVEIRVLK